jgi:adenine-specific DNA-methyltransferase
MAVEKEKSKFWSILENLYAGAKPDGESGYVNLIQKKREYFTDFVKPKLEEYVNQRIRDFPEFEEELYNKLYTFFEPYFSDTGSVFFVKSYIYYKQYERIYTNEDVKLFWKTKDLYYIKSDVLIRSMKVELEEGYTFYFDVSTVEHKQNNEKRELIYSFDKVDGNGKIVLKVEYSERGRQTKEDEIIKEVRKALEEEDKKIKSEHLRKAIQTFEKQMNVDYFIHRNLERFLKEQFNLWLSQYLLGHEEVNLPSDRINKLLALKDVAYRVIEVIARFEEELKRIWEKPRLVFNSNYVITLDRIANKGGLKIIKKLPKHEGWKDQVKEWIELGIIDEKPKRLIEGDNLKEEYQFLPIDTKYFKDLEPEILSLFEDLDDELDGWLIKSENWQALNTILPRFRGKIKTIYIDPPYNTGSDDFLYDDNYQHSSWLTMMENRLSLARELMRDDGVIFVSIGDTIKTAVRINSSSRLQCLLNELLNEDNFVANFVRKSGTAPRQDVKHIANSHDYVLCYAKNIDTAKINKKKADTTRLKYEDEYFKERGRFDLNQLDRGSKQYSESLDYPIVIEKGEIIEVFDGRNFSKIPAPERIEIWPSGDPNDKRWIFTWSKEKVSWGIRNGFIVFRKVNGKWKVYYKEYELVDNEGKPRERTNPYDTLILDYPNELGTSEIENLFGKRLFEYPKPSDLIKYLTEIGSLEDSLILDFFGGSGTTAHAVMKLNKEDGGKRKFILIEMANYFYDVIIPRIKKVAYSFNWEDGKPQDTDGIGVFVKYYELEQYEEILRNVEYNEESNKEFYEKMIENLKDVKFSELNPFLLDKRLAKAVKENEESIEVDLKELYPDREVDLLESMANVLGKSWKEVKDINDKGKKVEFYRRILLW